MKNPFTRREFLQSSLVVVSTIPTIPGFLQSSALALDAQAERGNPRNKPGVADGRILVVVQLSGGNDGLNTIVPFGQEEYYKARPTIAIPKDQVLRSGPETTIGLHPELRDYHALMEEGKAAVLLGVGYPNPNRSHFASMDIWHTGDTLGGRGLGWLGKALDETPSVAKASSTACICIGRESPLAAQGRRIKPVAFERAELFRWSGSDLHPTLAQKYDKFNRTTNAASAEDSQAAFVMRTALDAQLASDQVRAAVAKPPATVFPGGRLSDQLRSVAAMIRAELPTRVYYVAMGGFDTHANQPNTQGRLLNDFGVAMRAFQRELKAIGAHERVVTMAFSEFGRRVRQNASNGTDHGTASSMFVMGENIKAGFHGEYPSLTQLDDGDLIYTQDFRCAYAALLEQWLRVDSTKVLDKPFKQTPIFV